MPPRAHPGRAGHRPAAWPPGRGVRAQPPERRGPSGAPADDELHRPCLGSHRPASGRGRGRRPRRRAAAPFGTELPRGPRSLSVGATRHRCRRLPANAPAAKLNAAPFLESVRTPRSRAPMRDWDPKSLWDEFRKTLLGPAEDDDEQSSDPTLFFHMLVTLPLLLALIAIARR